MHFYYSRLTTSNTFEWNQNFQYYLFCFANQLWNSNAKVAGFVLKLQMEMELKPCLVRKRHDGKNGMKIPKSNFYVAEHANMLIVWDVCHRQNSPT